MMATCRTVEYWVMVPWLAAALTTLHWGAFWCATFLMGPWFGRCLTVTLTVTWAKPGLTEDCWAGVVGSMVPGEMMGWDGVLENILG